MVGRGADRIGRKIQVRIPDDDLSYLDSYALGRDITRAVALREIVSDWIQMCKVEP